MFGCIKCFHTTASLQKVYKLGWWRRTGEVRALDSDLPWLRLWSILGIHMNTLGANLHTIKGSLIHVAAAPEANRRESLFE